MSSILLPAPKWKCGECGRMYTTDEMLSLEKVQLVPEDTDPISQHGYTSKCTCGYVFHRDKWRLRDMLEISTPYGMAKVTVSTVFLELHHIGGWYETMIFNEWGDVKVSEDYQERYETQEEAEQRHREIVKLLREGKFTVKVTEVELSW